MGALNQSYNTSGEPVYDRDEITAHTATDFRLTKTVGVVWSHTEREQVMLPVASRLYRDTESNYHERWRTANCDGLYIGCGQLPPSPPHWRHFSVVSVLYTYCVILLTCLFADSMHETKCSEAIQKHIKPNQGGSKSSHLLPVQTWSMGALLSISFHRGDRLPSPSSDLTSYFSRDGVLSVLCKILFHHI